MGRMTTIMTTAALAMVFAGPAGAETWARFSSTDRTAYLVDLDSLTPTDGAATIRLARVPAQGDAGDLSHETEVVMVRCADRQAQSGATVAYGPTGEETDRYTEETPWETPSATSLYGLLLGFSCDDTRPAQVTRYPTIQAFIAGGRKG